MKYVMVSVHSPGDGIKRLVPVIFPNELVHASVYNSLRHSITYSGEPVTIGIRSAGFISLTELICYGESETLGVEAHPDDSEIIATFDYQGGFI